MAAITEAKDPIRVLMPNGSVVSMAMDEYLKGVVPHEVPPSWPSEALRAQAVAARSYASTRTAHLRQGADVCTTTHCQAWGKTHYPATDKAVDFTHGVVIRYKGSVIQAFFSAHCDGHTRNSEDVWVTALPYCRSVSCPCGYTFVFGHGVGMCQQGARTLAKSGHSYIAILKHYYTDVEVTAKADELPEPEPAPPVSGGIFCKIAFYIEFVQSACFTLLDVLPDHWPFVGIRSFVTSVKDDLGKVIAFLWKADTWALTVGADVLTRVKTGDLNGLIEDYAPGVWSFFQDPKGKVKGYLKDNYPELWSFQDDPKQYVLDRLKETHEELHNFALDPPGWINTNIGDVIDEVRWFIRDPYHFVHWWLLKMDSPLAPWWADFRKELGDAMDSETTKMQGWVTGRMLHILQNVIERCWDKGEPE